MLEVEHHKPDTSVPETADNRRTIASFSNSDKLFLPYKYHIIDIVSSSPFLGIPVSFLTVVYVMHKLLSFTQLHQFFLCKHLLQYRFPHSSRSPSFYKLRSGSPASIPLGIPFSSTMDCGIFLPSFI